MSARYSIVGLRGCIDQVASIYLRNVNAEGGISVKYSPRVKAKWPLWSMPSWSINRLELCGALLLAQTLNLVPSVLSRKVPICHLRAWLELSVVLSWLTWDQQHFKIFVTNQVTKIRQLLPDCIWNYVPTNHNPADPASRGLLPTSMLSSSIYWDGPEFLWLPESQWPP